MRDDARLLSLVFSKAHPIDIWNDRHGFRRDDAGATIKFSAYGDRSSEFGWEIDHIVQRQHGGSEILANLRPLHWRTNAARPD